MLAGRRLGCLAVVASLAILVSAFQARASTVVTWNASANLIDGVATQHAFDIAELYFSGFTANSLISIGGDGAWGSFDKPNRVLTMSVRLDGTWTEIYNSGAVPAFSPTVLLSALSTPMLFEPGVITGLRLATVGDVNYAFHKMLGTQFTFDLATSMPLPATLPLFGGGLAVVGLLGWWRQRFLNATGSGWPLPIGTGKTRTG